MSVYILTPETIPIKKPAHNSTFFIQPGGSLIFTTINRTPQSYLLAILGAEYVLNVVERGTHDWNKFIPDDELASLVIHSKCELYIG